jgi:YVTN family beta-propeller protein
MTPTGGKVNQGPQRRARWTARSDRSARSATTVLGTGAVVLATALSGCTSGPGPAGANATVASSTPATSTPATGPTSPRATATTPAAVNVYAHDGAGKIQGAARAAKALVYVPNTLSNTLQVIDPHTYKVIARYPTGHEPQHVVPSWDLKTLWVNDDLGNDLVPINPRTGRPGPKVAVADPYNLYFTPDGAHALVMAERLHRIDVRNPHTMALQRSLHVPCDGINHADYSADQSFFVASCEFSGKLLVVDKNATRVRKVINLNTVHTPGATTPMQAMHMHGPQSGLRPGASAMPQDVRLTPDGTRFLAADMLRNGIWVLNARTLKIEKFLPTGKGTHSIYPDRTATRLFAANRDAGTITVLDASTLKTLHTWHLPGGGSPDMGGVSADGRTLWLSGRYDSVVYVLNTTTGKLLKKIPVDSGPHGLCVWPQPGRYSLGHTGNMR